MDRPLQASLLATGLCFFVKLFADLSDNIGDGAEVPSVSYAYLQKYGKTGDVLFTSATTVTSLTRSITSSLFSHCGILVRRANGELYEWSSHCSAEDGTLKNGAQLVEIDKLMSISGQIFWRPVGATEEQQLKIEESIDMLEGQVKFPSVITFLAYGGSLFSWLWDNTKMNCAQLVALSLYSAGLIELDRDICHFTPSTFSITGDVRWTCKPRLTTYVIYGTRTKHISIRAVKNKEVSIK